MFNYRREINMTVDTKRQLINATKSLLSKSDTFKNLTARAISSEANTNLAMINYNFNSKDELIKIAVDEIISDEFQQITIHSDSTDSPKQQLKKLLYQICDITLKYKELTRLSMPYFLLNDDIKLPYDLLPYVKKHYGDKKSDSECKIIAFQLVYSFQLIFYRHADFYKYSGFNIDNKDDLHKLIDFNLDILLV